MRARITSIPNESYFFAMLLDTNERVFCHKNQCVDFAPSDCANGDVIDIGTTEENERGLKADDITYIERLDGETVRGVVVEVIAEKGFAFARLDGEIDNVFFHHSSTPVFNQLQRGDRVEGVVMPSPKGPRLERIQKI